MNAILEEAKTLPPGGCSSSDRLGLLEQETLSHPILNNEFLKQLRSGSFSKSQIALWVSQQFYFSIQFPRCLAALYARIEDFEISKPLVGFLSIEHWGSEVQSAHWKQFEQVLKYFDLDIYGLKNSVPFEETTQYLNYRLGICLC